jgi:hypothetical protein
VATAARLLPFSLNPMLVRAATISGSGWMVGTADDASAAPLGSSASCTGNKIVNSCQDVPEALVHTPPTGEVMLLNQWGWNVQAPCFNQVPDRWCCIAHIYKPGQRGLQWHDNGPCSEMTSNVVVQRSCFVRGKHNRNLLLSGRHSCLLSGISFSAYRVASVWNPHHMPRSCRGSLGHPGPTAVHSDSYGAQAVPISDLRELLERAISILGYGEDDVETITDVSISFFKTSSSLVPSGYGVHTSEASDPPNRPGPVCRQGRQQDGRGKLALGCSSSSGWGPVPRRCSRDRVSGTSTSTSSFLGVQSLAT